MSRTPSFGKKKEEAALKQDEKESDETKVHSSEAETVVTQQDQ